MKVLVTGSNGFIGKNLVANLELKPDVEIYKFDKNNSQDDLLKFTQDCEFVFHLAGVNRPQNPTEFIEGNCNLTSNLLDCLKKNGNHCPILMTSSIQAELENDYGKSKKQAEDIVFDFEKDSNNKVYVFRLPNVFGKWCRPNYNSVVATWCNNIANNLEIKINDENAEITLVYIDDVVKEFIKCLENKKTSESKFCFVPETYKIKLGELAQMLYSFKDERKTLFTPKVDNPLCKKLFSTYLSYLDKDDFAYELDSKIDNRGSFTECLKIDQGQISVNVCKPGITKGNHWHNTKIEKFLVVSGQCEIKFRKKNTDEIIKYELSDSKLEIIDIPPGYVHNFTNTGEANLIVLIWCNEHYDKDNPDTFYEEV